MKERNEITRRTILKSLSILPATGMGKLFALRPHWHGWQPSTPQESWKPLVLSSHQNETVAVISELIVPETDTPGARAAKVNEFIDFTLSREDNATREAFLRGLEWMDQKSNALYGASFIRTSTEQQIALLQRISDTTADTSSDERAGQEFFKDMKDRTIAGYYTSEIGLVQELEFQGNTFLSEFQGCQHQDH